jgi:hypothetical protein
MTKIQNSAVLLSMFWSFEHLNFNIVSGFGFRASDLSTAKGDCAR